MKWGVGGSRRRPSKPITPSSKRRLDNLKVRQCWINIEMKEGVRPRRKCLGYLPTSRLMLRRSQGLWRERSLLYLANWLRRSSFWKEVANLLPTLSASPSLRVPWAKDLTWSPREWPTLTMTWNPFQELFCLTTVMLESAFLTTNYLGTWRALPLTTDLATRRVCLEPKLMLSIDALTSLKGRDGRLTELTPKQKSTRTLMLEIMQVSSLKAQEISITLDS